jgi:anti-anti-sigma regulatory factor
MKASIDDTSCSNFEIHENVLVANVELYWENHAEFLKHCEELLHSDYKDIILDLSPVTFIFSAYMGTIGRLLAETTSSDKHLTIRIGSNLTWLFEMLGLENMVDIEVVA